jgi:hypothetical protein
VIKNEEKEYPYIPMALITVTSLYLLPMNLTIVLIMTGRPMMTPNKTEMAMGITLKV